RLILHLTYHLSVRPRLFSSLCFFSLIPPPPSSTLFPYTTLFRSPFTVRCSFNGFPARCLHSSVRSSWCYNYYSTSRSVYTFTSKDRKSTRLNSSHVSISYAVFCLKKKIIKNT